MFLEYKIINSYIGFRDLLFNSEDGDMFLRNVCWFSLDYTGFIFQINFLVILKLIYNIIAAIVDHTGSKGQEEMFMNGG